MNIYVRDSRLIIVVAFSFLAATCTSPSREGSVFPADMTEDRDASDISSPSPHVSDASPSPDLTATVSSKQTITPIGVAIPTSTPVIRYQTITIETTVSPGYGLEGVLVLDTTDSEAMGFLLDLSSWEKHALNSAVDSDVLFPDWTWPSVSPDGTWLAYIERWDDPPLRQLRIVSSDGQQQPTLNWGDDWSGDIVGWLDNDRLVLNNWLYEDARLDVYDPHNGDWQELLASFPLNTPNGEIWAVLYNPLLIYDPSLTLVVYFRYQRAQDRTTYELWETQSENVLWERSVGGIDSRPIWSPNGENFAMIYLPYSDRLDPSLDYGRLFVIGRSGEEVMLTDQVAGELAWSPDGRHIATWWRGDVNFDRSQPERWTNFLVIVDVLTRDMTIYSVGNASSAQHPIWSPDGRMIALVSYRETGEPVDNIATRVVVVDLINNRAFEVAKEASVRGWMISTQ